MRVSITGSRSLSVSHSDIQQFLPVGTTTIVSGGAVGVDSVASSFAQAHGLGLVVIRPSYSRPSDKLAPLLRNTSIVSQSDYCLFFWDGASRGTAHTIAEARHLGRSGCVVVRGLVSHSFSF